MKFEIPEEIIKKTNCNKNYICLKEHAEKEICKIDKCIDNKYCLLKKIKYDFCINRFSFGNSQMCKCPVRIEIFNKYGI